MVVVVVVSEPDTVVSVVEAAFAWVTLFVTDVTTSEAALGSEATAALTTVSAISGFAAAAAAATAVTTELSPFALPALPAVVTTWLTVSAVTPLVGSAAKVATADAVASRLVFLD